MLRGLHAAEDLSKLQTQLADIYGIAVAMAKKVDHIGDKVDDMKSSVDDLKTMMTRVKRNRDAVIASSGQMPVPPSILIGHDAVVDKVAYHLVSGDTPRSQVFILAPWGKGKTSTTLAVMKHPSVLKKFEK